MDLDKFLPDDHHHYQYGGSKHEANVLDGVFSIAAAHRSENVRYIYVGPNRGRYEESTRGNFHYVGPCKGHFEKECLPPDHTGRNCFICTFVVLFVALIVFVMHAIFQEPTFDCAADYENWQTNWSGMKKEYCCANERRGCDGSKPAGDKYPEVAPHEPEWMLETLPELGIGAKFIMSALFSLIVGACCGVSLLFVWVRYFHVSKKAKTELQLVAEINKQLEKAHASKGEIQVSLMWDTKDDLDLHLLLPDKKSEVSVDCPEVDCFHLDICANTCHLEAKKKLTDRPVESICWISDPENPTMPPKGEYCVWVKVFEKHDHAKDAKITVIVTIAGKREIYHLRIIPGVTTVKVCTFHYPCKK